MHPEIKNVTFLQSLRTDRFHRFRSVHTTPEHDWNAPDMLAKLIETSEKKTFLKIFDLRFSDFFRISIVGFLIIFRKFSNLENFGSRFLKLHRTDHFQTFGGVHNGYKHHRNGCDTLAKAMAVFLKHAF